MRSLVFLVVALLVLAFSADARAHASRAAYLDVTEIGEGEATASLRADAHARVTLSSQDCTIEALPARGSQSVTLSRVRCPGGLAGAAFVVGGLEGSDVVIARVVLEHGGTHGSVLTARSPELVIPLSGDGRSVFAHYVRMGIEHVLSGLDHVLFLLALVWQAYAASRGALRSWASELLRAATAFTVAHTLTLTATTLGWLHVPSDVAEIMIAVSLVLVALDVGRMQSTFIPSSSRLGVVMAFGLVHGLGFAGALAGARLPENAVALGLLGFNVGVELGQLGLLAGAVALISIVPLLLRARAATFSAYAIGATGAFLLIARSGVLFR